MLKCTRCRAKAEVQLRQHNSGFCRPCFLLFFQRQAARSIRRERMIRPGEAVLVAVSGGKDSLALWDVLVELGYETTGLHLALGIGEYSHASTEKTVAFAEARGLPLLIENLADHGLGVSEAAAHTNRPPCSACGTFKRHFFDRIAADRGFPVVATGHNLDDEAARLLGNVLHWRTEYLARQHPVLEPTHDRFVRKVKPLFRATEYEAAVYAFFRGIDYQLDECPNSVGATQLLYKDLLNRLEASSPGTKLTFVQDYLRRGHPRFAGGDDAGGAPGTCERCGMPSFAAVCSFCKLVDEVRRKQEQRAARASA